MHHMPAEMLDAAISSCSCGPGNQDAYDMGRTELGSSLRCIADMRQFCASRQVGCEMQGIY